MARCTICITPSLKQEPCHSRGVRRPRGGNSNLLRLALKRAKVPCSFCPVLPFQFPIPKGESCGSEGQSNGYGDPGAAREGTGARRSRLARYLAHLLVLGLLRPAL